MGEKRLTHEEITKEALEMFAKETEHFAGVLGIPKDKPKKERPFVTKQMIDKAKKKLKKLQKRQRKQDKQGVSNTADQWPSDTLDKLLAGQNEPYVINMIKHAKITEEMMDVIRQRYGVGIKPKIVGQMTIDEFVKWRDNTKTQSID